MIKLFKVGGRCLDKNGDSVAKQIAKLAYNVEKESETCVVVHGYSHALATILDSYSIKRLKFVTGSGMRSKFTTQAVLAASHFAASLTHERFLHNLCVNFSNAKGVMGFQGCLIGRRKNKIRYKENGVLKVFKDDWSGRIEEIHGRCLELRGQPNGVVLLTPLLADQYGGILVCDADHVAAQVAIYFGLSHYTIFSDTNGFRVHGKTVERIPVSRISEYMEHANGGMSKKIHYIAQALKQGVRKIHLLSGMETDVDYTKGTIFYAD
jgi:acetylglutamate/LysW-gamma-L-alpha-aminoadipate kinase